MMALNLLLTLVAGLVAGSLTGYFVLRNLLRKHYTPNSEAEQLRIALAQRLTREQVEERYVSREVYANVQNSVRERDGQLANLQNHIFQKDNQILELSTQHTALQKANEHLEDKLDNAKKELDSLLLNAREQFKVLAEEIVKEKGKDLSDANRTSMDALLNPLKTDILSFKKTIEDTRKEDIQDLTSLKKEIESLQKMNTRLSEDAQRLAGALRSDVKVQGNWGEDRLKLILEAEGLQNYIDFTNQGTYRDEEEGLNRRPDCILRLPDGKHLVIDSKVSLNAYIEYFNAADPVVKKDSLKQLVRNINDHIDLLANKNYQSLSGLQTPDFVFMFMHFESALTLAMNESPDIFNRALQRKIVIITPTTLVATMKVVKLLWQKENRVKNVEEIFRQCGLLYDKFVMFTEEMQKVGKSISDADRAYHDAMNRLRDGARKSDTIIGKFQLIQQLEAKTTRKLPDNILNGISMLEENE
ncbi:DNA recombination protein RmuC [Chitinophaga horti]|uniref:DNA recombination protein RmuC n=1 Tax=Chitinophaga horti TaxID=2920382 RepID=A0ABY6J045_9BACT|nr:DNA recombination protein RmuC [Chitinophaga horti]UYQ91614.1 DNA recombination protein RmuC [Chitinophaga horti]